MPQRTLSLHSHTVYSQRDSIIKPKEAAAKIAQSGGTHYSVTDHGTIQGWLAVRDACKAEGITPIYGCELYVNDGLPLLNAVLTERDKVPPKEKPERVLGVIRDLGLHILGQQAFNYLCTDLDPSMDQKEVAKILLQRLSFGYQHLCAVAVTEEGRQNLIRLVNHGWMHGYRYKPQVTTEDCLKHADGLVWTTACMGGPIARRLHYDPTGAEAIAYLQKWEHLKSRFFLEVQPLDLLAQRRYNQQLINLSQQTGFPLILSQDNHHLNEEDWVSHRILMLGQNDKHISTIEDRYAVNGKEMGFSELKKHLGVKETWKAQEIIEQEAYQVVVKAGHHYGDVRLHWRTNDEVRQQVETTNPELLAVIDQCFAVTDALCAIPNLDWSHEFRIPKYEDTRSKVMRICVSKLQELGKSDDIKYVEWLVKEDKVISACGFYDYIWTLYMLCTEVQNRGIPIGYARGSGGGCLIMYLLGIIRVDPVQFDLFFDRFLNPARLGLNPITLEKEQEMASCPDVDLDFSSIHRKSVIVIAEELFGKDRVVPVGTIGEVKLKTALADICRVCGIPQSEYIPVSKELPEDANGSTTFSEGMSIDAFKNFMQKYPIVASHLSALIGTTRSTGQHAGGICIADVPIAENIPVVRAGSKEGAGLVTGFGESGAVRALESIGYIKFDCLATDTVDHVSQCAVSLYQEMTDNGQQVPLKEGERILYPEQLPHYTFDDPKVMEHVFHRGNTDGIFQFEEAVGKDMAKLIKPNTVLEIADISTMIRPGCLKAPASYATYVTDDDGQQHIAQMETVGLQHEYVARKRFPEINPPPTLPEPILEVLKDTYSCCIYQEQMMFLIERLTGGKMSLGEGDIYRRMIEQMGKGKADAAKKVEELEAQMKELSPYDPHVVDLVTRIIKGGASYAFNKSHSLSYSLFSYAQAWFKTYYPHIFYASHVSLLAAKGKMNKMHKIVNNARSSGITITSPHIRWSSDKATWTPDGKTIFLPFTIMKGITNETSEAIAQWGKECETIEDFCLRALRDPKVKKNQAISLAKIGSLDGLSGLPRIHIMAIVGFVFAACTAKTPEKKVLETIEKAKQWYICGDLDKQRMADAEIEVFGGFVNECPLSEEKIEQLSQKLQSLSEVVNCDDTGEFHVYFLITGITKKVHKSGNSQGREWYKLTCWDGNDVCDLSIWAHDLDPAFEDDGETIKHPGYRGIIRPNHIYSAIVQKSGDRPISLAFKKTYDGYRETLYLQSN